MENAAKALAKKYHASILLKGGHLRGDNAIDLLFHQGELTRVLGAVCARRRNTRHRLHVFGSNHCGSGVRLLVRTGHQTREEVCHRIDQAKFSLEVEIRARSRRTQAFLLNW